MSPWEIAGKVGEFDEDWRVAALYSVFLRLLNVQVQQILS